MSEDPRPDVPNVPVAEPVIERFRGVPEPLANDVTAIYNSVAALKEVVETLAGERGEEGNAAVLFRHLFPEGVAGDSAYLGDYYLRHDTHTALTPPLYLDDPHQQYWHIVRDTAWAHMRFEDLASPKEVNVGEPITAWTSKVINDWQLESDLLAGTITLAQETDIGTYHVSISGFTTGGANNNWIVAVYANGAPTGIIMPVMYSPNTDGAPIAWSGVVSFPAVGALDIRIESGTGPPLSFYAINWSVHRINPLPGIV